MAKKKTIKRAKKKTEPILPKVLPMPFTAEDITEGKRIGKIAIDTKDYLDFMQTEIERQEWALGRMKDKTDDIKQLLGIL
jgi:hypothetical protein